jgi:hypothetical protein
MFCILEELIEEVRELKRWAEEKRVWTQGRGKIKGKTVMFKQKKPNKLFCRIFNF